MKQFEQIWKKHKGKVLALAIPVITFLIAELICSLTAGRHIFETPLDMTNFLRQCSINTIAGYALYLNMANGRMDMSLGGQKLVAGIIGGNLALSLGLPAWGILVTSVLFGTLAGLFTGILYVTFRLPAIILGIGAALIFEAVSAAYSTNGFQLYGKSGMGMLSNVWFILGCAVVVVFIMWILLDKSKFGVHYRAIAGSQKIARTSGIKIYARTVVCYTICGALIGFSGILETGVSGIMSTSMNLTSISIAFTSFVPVFGALMMQRWISGVFGLPIAVITFRILSMAITVFRLPQAASSVITMGMLLLLLLVMNLAGNADYKKMVNARIEMARQAQ